MSFFQPIYADEILYSLITRYHSLSGNVNLKNTLEECFGSDTITSIKYFPSSLDYLSAILSSTVKYDSNFLINECTLLPLYIPFLPKERREKIIHNMKTSKGKSIHSLLGIQAGGIFKDNELKYCPLCVNEDIDKFGEAYFHRIHQADGIIICHKHGCLIKSYSNNNLINSRLEFIRLDEANIDFEICYEKDIRINEVLMKISAAIKFLLESKLYSFDIKQVHDMYLRLLGSRGYVTSKGSIRQRMLYSEFKNFYGEIILNRLNSNFNEHDESNWLKIITRKQRRIVQPLRHILFILFLCGEGNIFFDSHAEYYPFGKGPWLCLNSAADHYKNRIVTDLKITDDYHTRKPIGTFKCKCGFVYSRKGPDVSLNDKFRIGRIKQFGDVWENKLRSLAISREHGLRALGRLMECDPKTVVRYAEKLGVIQYINTSQIVKSNKLHEITYMAGPEKFSVEYKNRILDTIRQNSNYSRTQIRNLLKREYSWLYKNERKWLIENLPNKQNSSLGKNAKNERVDWEERDMEIQQLIENAYNKAISNDRQVRITKSILGQIIGKKTLLDNCLEKLPRTNLYLGSITETIEEFQSRRISRVLIEITEEYKEIKKWRVIRRAGIRPNYFDKLDECLEKIKE